MCAMWPYNAISMITTWFPFGMNIKSKQNCATEQAHALSFSWKLKKMEGKQKKNEQKCWNQKLAININRKSKSLDFGKGKKSFNCVSCWSYTIQDFKQMRHSPGLFTIFFFYCITQHKFRATNSIKIQHSVLWFIQFFLSLFLVWVLVLSTKQLPFHCTHNILLLMLVGSLVCPTCRHLFVANFSSVIKLICSKKKETDRRRKKQHQKKSTKKKKLTQNQMKMPI